jgi:hypothetical protein
VSGAVRRRGLVVALLALLAVAFLTRHAWLVRAGAWLANARAADALTPADAVAFDAPSGWAPVIRTGMDDAWKDLHRRGFNSFAFGAPEHPFAGGAAREDPASPRYQAWFGVYSVVLDGPGDLALDEAGLVAFADSLLRTDQLRWLATMGDPKPFAAVARRAPNGTIRFLGADATLYEGEVATHSDLGEPVTRAARFLGRPSDWRDRVAPYHALSLEGFVAVNRDAARKRLYVAWGNGVRFDNVRTWPKLREEILEMARSARIAVE